MLCQIHGLIHGIYGGFSSAFIRRMNMWDSWRGIYETICFHDEMTIMTGTIGTNLTSPWRIYKINYYKYIKYVCIYIYVYYIYIYIYHIY